MKCSSYYENSSYSQGRIPDSLQPTFPWTCHTSVLHPNGIGGLVWSGSVEQFPSLLSLGVGQSQVLPVSGAPSTGDLISPSVLPLKRFQDNFKDNGMLLESMETVFRVLFHHENEHLKSCLAWMTLVGSCYPMTRTHLRPWNTEKLVTSNTRTDAKTPNGGRGWHHTSHYPSSVYFSLEYVVKKWRVLPFYIQQCPRYSRGSIKCR